MKIEAASKCGEIYRSGSAFYTFGCTQCGQVFLSTNEIFEHIETHFLSEPGFNKTLEYVPALNVEANDTTELVIKEEECIAVDVVVDEYYQNCEALEFAVSADSAAETGEASNQIEKRNGRECTNKTTETKTVEDYYVKCNYVTQKDDTVECNYCGKFMKRRNIRHHLDIHFGNVKFPCTICKKKLRTQAAVKHHLWHDHFGKIINRNEIVECDICGKKVKKRSIRNHLDIHSTKQKFSCSVCNKKVQTKPALKSHEKRHRTKEMANEDKNYSCEVCGWLFRDSGNLLKHMRRHTGEKPYQCKVCGKCFTHSSYINIHMRTHTGERPYKCTLCIASFKGKSALRFHIRNTHSKLRPFKCTTCEKSYTRIRSLREHQRVHTGERPYVCTVCNSNFSRSNAYKQHILLHTGIKSYKCKYCDMSFSQIAGRASHAKSAHKTVDTSVLQLQNV